jgi:dTDP-4-dehydrorhamnose 3,5-epimerase
LVADLAALTMEIIPTQIAEVRIIIPAKHVDQRGFLSETYSKRGLAEAGIELDFVQDNHSFSLEKGVVRGLHYQAPPFAQDKLLRVVRGAVFDVAVDLRRNSRTFGKHVSAILSAEKWNQILIPKGFAHGFATLEPSTELIYKVTNYYYPEYDRGLFWRDSEIGIDWPVSPAAAIVSEKDGRLPRLCELKDLFD